MPVTAERIRRVRGGFSLTEILVALTIAAIVAAMVYPVLATKLRGSQSAAVSQTFAGLAQGIAEFKRATSRYPSSLSMLTTQPAATDPDICNNAISATNVALW